MGVVEHHEGLATVVGTQPRQHIVDTLVAPYIHRRSPALALLQHLRDDSESGLRQHRHHLVAFEALAPVGLMTTRVPGLESKTCLNVAVASASKIRLGT